MARTCPGCDAQDQVVHLGGFWASLPQDAELKGRFAPPTVYAGRVWIPALVLLLGAVLLASGGVALGLVLLSGGVVSGVWMAQQTSATRAAKAKWDRTMYCRHCHSTFD